MRTRKKIAVGVGLLLLALLVPVLVAWWLAPGWPPLRVGMKEEEVEQALGMRVSGMSGPGPTRIVTYEHNPGNEFDPDPSMFIMKISKW